MHCLWSCTAFPVAAVVSGTVWPSTSPTPPFWVSSEHVWRHILSDRILFVLLSTAGGRSAVTLHAVLDTLIVLWLHYSLLSRRAPAAGHFVCYLHSLVLLSDLSAAVPSPTNPFPVSDPGSAPTVLNMFAGDSSFRRLQCCLLWTRPVIDRLL